MKISTSVMYALASAGYIAKNYKDSPVRAASISKEYSISIVYLQKVLQQLVRANILISKKGPRGGFTLARDPKDITMLQIIEAVDGPTMRYLNMAEQTQNEKFALKMEEICNKATEKAIQIYDKAKLSAMVLSEK